MEVVSRVSWMTWTCNVLPEMFASMTNQAWWFLPKTKEIMIGRAYCLLTARAHKERAWSSMIGQTWQRNQHGTGHCMWRSPKQLGKWLNMDPFQSVSSDRRHSPTNKTEGLGRADRQIQLHWKLCTSKTMTSCRNSFTNCSPTLMHKSSWMRLVGHILGDIFWWFYWTLDYVCVIRDYPCIVGQRRILPNLEYCSNLKVNEVTEPFLAPRHNYPRLWLSFFGLRFPSHSLPCTFLPDSMYVHDLH
jgi:hypothetical protein